MSRPPSPAAVRELRAAVRGALLLEAGRDSTWRPDPAVEAADLVAAVDRHRVAPLLATYADRLGLPAAVADPVRQRHDRVRLLSMNVVHQVGRVRQALDDAGIPWLVVKGPALAAQTTGDFTARGAGDVDVLVAPRDAATAWHALVEAGWAPEDGWPRPGPSWAWRHHLRSHYEVPLRSATSSVDLHWSLHPARGVLPDFDACHARATTVSIGNLTVPTLAPEDAFLHTCAHAARDQFRWLRSVVDVHRLLLRCAPSRDQLAGPRVRTALTVTDATVGLPPGHPSYAAAPAWVVRAALAAQERPAEVRGRDVPGLGTLQAVGRTCRGAGAREYARVLGAHVLGHQHVAGIDDEQALRAVPRAVLARLESVGSRVSGLVRDPRP